MPNLTITARIQTTGSYLTFFPLEGLSVSACLPHIIWSLIIRTLHMMLSSTRPSRHQCCHRRLFSTRYVVHFPMLGPEHEDILYMGRFLKNNDPRLVRSADLSRIPELDLAAQLFAAILMLFVRRFRRPSYRPVRGIFFSFMASSAFYPFIYGCSIHDYARMDIEAGANRYLLTIITYLSAVTIYTMSRC